MRLKRFIPIFISICFALGAATTGVVFADGEITTLFYEPFNYTKGQSISQSAASARGWSIQNENTVPSGKGSTALVKDDPADSSNAVLDIEALSTAYTSAARYAQITGPFSAGGRKYILVSKKARITTTGNKFIFYINGTYADASTGTTTSSNSILVQLTYDIPNGKVGTDTSSGYKEIATTGIPLNRWVDVKFLFDCAAQTFNLYFDDVKVNSAPVATYGGYSSGKVISGIRHIEMGSNRWISSAGHFYIDDLTVAACNEEGILKLDADKLTVSENVSGDFELPVSGVFGSSISWSSSNSSVISISGGTADVTAPANDTNVTLTATLSLGGVTRTETFTVTVYGDSVRMSDMNNKLTTYVFSGQKYVSESFTPNLPGLINTDTVQITSSDPAVSYNPQTNRVTVTQGEEDKIVNVTVSVSSAAGNSFTKTLKFYVPFASIVSFYEGFDYPSLKGQSLTGAANWNVANENTNLSTTGSTTYVEASPDDPSDLVMNTHVYRGYGSGQNQYPSLTNSATVMGDAIIQANFKFDSAKNRYIWYIYGTVKTSSGENGKTLLEFTFNRNNNQITCKSNGTDGTLVTSTPLPTNEWFNIKIVLHSTENTFDMYKDNVKLNSTPIQIAQVTSGGTVIKVGAMNFGVVRWDGNPGDMYMDDLMIRYSAADLLSTEADMLSLPETLIYDYALPTTGVYEGTTISWTSDNPGVLSSNGKVNRNPGLGQTVVGLTANIEAGGSTYQKQINVKVVNTPYYTVDSLLFETSGGDDSYRAESGGKVKQMHVTKYTNASNDNAAAYVAVYGADGRLLRISAPTSVAASGNISINMDLPAAEGMYAKAFIFNSQTLEPLAYSYSTKLAEGATLYTIGDSTMQSYGALADRRASNDMTGWAQVLPLAIANNSITVDNEAVAGTSTLSFYNLGYIHPIYNNIKPGDYLLIQFGHNDEKPWISEDAAKNYSPLEPVHQAHPKATEVPDWAASRKTYEQWLREYAAAARMKGAQVIFATSIYRRAFDNGEPAYSHYGYPEAMIDTAAETGTPVLDLCTRTGEWLAEKGEEGSKQYYLSYYGGTDNTHLIYDGAVEVANMAIGEMRRIGHPLEDAFTTVPAR